MAPEREVGFDSLLDRSQAELLEPEDLALGEGFAGEVR